jgi:hypothetical protein
VAEEPAGFRGMISGGGGSKTGVSCIFGVIGSIGKVTGVTTVASVGAL